MLGLDRGQINHFLFSHPPAMLTPVQFRLRLISQQGDQVLEYLDLQCLPCGTQDS